MTSSAREPHVLHEDNHVIVLFKPFGVPTQGDLTGDPSLLEQVKSFLKRRDAKPGNVYLGLVHRLDRPVAGVVVFAKTSKAASRLSEQFRERDVRKFYHAVVGAAPEPPAGTLEHFLGEENRAGASNRPPNRVLVRTTAAPGFKTAKLHYKTIESRAGRSLLEVELETGRKHQIRAQLAAIGAPILGDRKYGGADLPASSPIARARGIALVAARIDFAHPVRRDETVTIELPPELDPLPSLLAP